MAVAVDERPGAVPPLPATKEPASLIVWAVKALGQAAGVPVAVLLVAYLWGADIDASNAKALERSQAIIDASKASAARDAQYRLQSIELTRKAKLEADKLEAGP